MNDELWKKVMSMKKADNRHKGIANNLDNLEIETILASMDFFNASDDFLAQARFDLKVARYRVFDWLAMIIMSRWHYQEGDEFNKLSAKVLIHSFLKSNGDVNKFIADLRENDYQVDQSYEAIVI